MVITSMSIDKDSQENHNNYSNKIIYHHGNNKIIMTCVGILFILAAGVPGRG